MFFKMLKNDLRSNRGLNITLFFFICCAAIISVIAANLMYMELSGRRQTDEISNIANIAIECNPGMGNFDEKKDQLIQWMVENEDIIEGELREYFYLANTELSVNGRIASDPSFPKGNPFHITTLTERISLLFNDNDESFSIHSGEAAVSLDLADAAGIHRGDTIRITSQLGQDFEFTVSEIYKLPSSMEAEELIISDADYEYLKSEFPFRLCRLLIRTYDISLSMRLEKSLDDTGLVKDCWSIEYSPEIDPQYTIVVAVSYLIALISVVIILMMFITIRFMMVATMKREEKEIGMMRAIGIDSFRYRWMFAAVYIVFAAIGGIAGLTAGTTLSKYILRQLCKNYIISNHYIVYIIAVIVSIILVAAILLFAMLMMRRIRRISVVEAIRGNAKGERFERVSRIDLYKTKHIRVPQFLAASNIINGAGKYIFLIVTYALGTVVMLTVFYVRSTLLSHEYQKNFMLVHQDFALYMNSDMYSYYYQKGGDSAGVMQVLEEEMNENGLPVRIRYVDITDAELIKEDGDNITFTFMFGDTFNEEFPLRKGGALPVHENEAMVSYFTAKKEGMQIGDTITIELDEYDDDRIGSHKVVRSFLITGFFDIMEAGHPEIVAGCEYDGAVKNGIQVTDMTIDAPKSRHKEIMERMKSIYGDDVVQTFEESMKRGFEYVLPSIDALKIILGILTALIFLLNTTLYTSVNIVNETPGIATLKCIGFSNRDVRLWQMLRTLIIIGISLIFGYIFEDTAGNLIGSKIFETFGVTGYRFVADPVEKWLFVPLLIIIIILAVTRLSLIKLKGINIWNIREE